MNIEKQMASPLVFTYNNPITKQLGNVFTDASGSPLPGAVGTTLYTLESPNINLQGLTLTLQYYNNVVRPVSGAKTSLFVANTTVLATSGTNTIGTLGWQQQYPNPVPGNDPLVLKGRIAKLSSTVDSATGIFVNYLFGNMITTLDSTTGDRKISIYSAE